ncbi:DNA-binding transcriptional LysR family regulator [Sphingomonas vulcanisoli]|uniref:DNA-binding transcriptional LysR family regulator n=1 Tax=Sphingomonas vulcanisoli TaxID=1658060 RepID=A0ABX0TU58_9SPHN|nr:LysR family transcriptional regulator [Sphingomonas vulcanisoli]NIJ09061.1 DNA-binding transcriptional LysR family regulator [Sphingomonas vulcanisoli]
MLDRYLLRYFLAVVDQGNFSRAAESCNVAQPTLSVGIAKLERLLGRPVFIRSNQRVELTAAGSAFLVHARRIEGAFNAAARSMALSAELPSFRLAVLSSIPTSPVADSVAQVRPGESHRFELIFGSEREIVGHIAKGRVDLALTLVDRGTDRFAERAFMTEGYALAMAATHPLATHSDISADKLANEIMIVRRHCEALSETSRFFTERGVRPHFALRSTNDDRVLQMVAAGLGITVMPQSYRLAGVSRPRLAGFAGRRTIGWMAAHHCEHFLDTPLPLMKTIQQRLVGLDGGQDTAH